MLALKLRIGARKVGPRFYEGDNVEGRLGYDAAMIRQSMMRKVGIASS
jgi:hypothetical protein